MNSNAVVNGKRFCVDRFVITAILKVHAVA